MKPTIFFYQESRVFLEQLNNIKLVEFDYSISNDIYKDIINGDNSEYSTQSNYYIILNFKLN